MSIINLRSYQKKLIEDIEAGWNAGHQNVCAQLVTGGGKTIIFSEIILKHQGYAMVVVHRGELLSQISQALANCNIEHDIIAAHATVRAIVNLHLTLYKRSYFKSQCHIMIASVDTLKKRVDNRFKQVTLLIQDEGHHALKTNKWGFVSEFFPNARGLYPTATPCRADGRGLGRHADGIIDHLVCGPHGRELINAGYLSDYYIIAPPSDLNLSHVPLSSGGDYSPRPLDTAIKKSKIIGDAVTHYKRHAGGKLGLTFCTSIESATLTAQAYNQAGIPAEVISGKTPINIRANLLEKFKRRELMQLVSVDIFGEGVDIPAIEVLTFLRPTNSYAVYAQQFGRSLRIMPGKDRAIIIDHVGNVMRHGLPDAKKVWSLNRKTKKQNKTEVINIKVCGNERCAAVYMRFLKKCPYCGFFKEPASRSEPEFVDGDLIELSDECLRRMRGEIEYLDSPPRIYKNLEPIAQLSLNKKHRLRQEAQAELREAIAQWAGVEKHLKNKNDSEIYRSFYIDFGIDILSAQALPRSKSLELIETIKNYLTLNPGEV